MGTHILARSAWVKGKPKRREEVPSGRSLAAEMGEGHCHRKGVEHEKGNSRHTNPALLAFPAVSKDLKNHSSEGS